jgi:alpha-tubulin suppressor-like RCC1 family protein
MMDVTPLILNLKSQLNNCTLDQQMISKAIKLLELGVVYQADSFAALPAADGTNAGQLYYVLYDGVYWSTGQFWIPIAQSEFNLAWSWGFNSLGQLGDGTTTNRSSPVSMLGNITNWCQVSAGARHGLGVTTSGSAWAWGYNGRGQLGNSSTITSCSPVSVVGINNWCQVSASGCEISTDGVSVGITQTGQSWSWGTATLGLLGNNTATPNRSSPVSVVGGFTDWCASSVGARHVVAIRQNGSTWGWGSNTNGRLGDNATTSRSSPVSVVGNINNWCAVSAGYRHTVAVTDTGVAWSWGCNSAGQLGHNNTTSRLSPVSVVGNLTWCQLSAGFCHTLGITTNSVTWSWGDNSSGQLGHNNTTNRSSPMSVVGSITNWCEVAAGTSWSQGLTAAGELWSWGQGAFLGDNTTINRSSPVSVTFGSGDWCQVSAGQSFTVAIQSKST